MLRSVKVQLMKQLEGRDGVRGQRAPFRLVEGWLRSCCASIHGGIHEFFQPSSDFQSAAFSSFQPLVKTTVADSSAGHSCWRDVVYRGKRLDV